MGVKNSYVTEINTHHLEAALGQHHRISARSAPGIEYLVAQLIAVCIEKLDKPSVRRFIRTRFFDGDPATTSVSSVPMFYYLEPNLTLTLTLPHPV